MSQGGRSEEVGRLRDAIARIEGAAGELAAPCELAATCGPGGGARQESLRSQAGTARTRVPLGDGLGLDRVLGGGLGRAALHEIVAAAPGDAGAACGFALALAARFAAAAPAKAMAVAWIVEDGARRESGAPYAPGLAAHGLDPARLLLVRTPRGPETLWAMEEALKCGALAAVVAELWRVGPYDLVASRRLTLAAQKGTTPGLLLASGAAGAAESLSSAARTRFEIAARPAPPPLAPGQRLPVPGRAAWHVRLARIRAGPGGASHGFDQDKLWPLVWDHEEARFRDALSFPAPALSADRPDPPAPLRHIRGGRASRAG